MSDENSKGKVFIALPCYTDACANGLGYRQAMLRNGLYGKYQFACEIETSSILPTSFNSLWCKALMGDFDWFIMLHSDIVPETDWALKLIELAKKHDADVMSALSPIKSHEGLFSAGVGNPDNRWNPLFRFTASQLRDWPPTFAAADIGFPDCPLFVNTGCFAVNLRKPWVRLADENGRMLFRFEFMTEIIKEEEDKFIQRTQSEDWRASWLWHDLGCKVMNTREVELDHFGTRSWKNTKVWGQLMDSLCSQPDYLKRVVHPSGYWLDRGEGLNVFDYTLAQALCTFFKGKTVWDLGCGEGDDVHRLNENGIRAAGVDGRPPVRENAQQADLTKPFGGTSDWVLSIEVGEHIPRTKEQAFFDNLASVPSQGVVMSWAPPGNGGRGHVNCRPADYVIWQMKKRGFTLDKGDTSKLRAASCIDFLQAGLMVFRKSASDSLSGHGAGLAEAACRELISRRGREWRTR